MNKNEIINILNKKYNADLDETYEYVDFKEYYSFSKDNYTYFFNKDFNDVDVLGDNNKTIHIPRYSRLDRINGLKTSYEVLKKFKEDLDKFDKNENNKILNRFYIIIEGFDMEKEEKISIVKKLENNHQNFYDDEDYDEEIDQHESMIEKYGICLNNNSYLKDPAIGRENEIRKLEQILLYPEKDKSIIIVGESGIGKTSLVHGLAYRIKNNNVPEQLKDLVIISIDVTTMVAGNKYVGILEEKMKSILDEISEFNNTILFIDNIHRTLSGGVSEEDDNSISDILKPYLDFGKIRVIGATTTEDYNNKIEKDQTYKSLFKKIEIKEPDDGVIYQILDDMICKYNNLNCPKLFCSDEEKDMYIKWLIRSTSKKRRDYFDSSNNPRLVTDILKHVYAIASINNRKYIIKDDFIEAIFNEERLSKSGIEKAKYELDNLVPDKKSCKIYKLYK